MEKSLIRKIDDTEVIIEKIMIFSDTNEFGEITASEVAKFAEITADMTARLYKKGKYLTACVDQMFFKQGVKVNDRLIVKADINYIQKTSMEVGMRIEVDENNSGNIGHVTSIYMVLIAVDSDNMPVKITPLIFTTAEKRRRYREASFRMEKRLLALRKSERDSKRVSPNTEEAV